MITIPLIIPPNNKYTSLLFLQCFLRSAQKGDVNAMCNIALGYQLGNMYEKDEEQCVEWYRKAANGGLVRAQYELAMISWNAETSGRADDNEVTIQKRVDTYFA